MNTTSLHSQSQIPAPSEGLVGPETHALHVFKDKLETLCNEAREKTYPTLHALSKIVIQLEVGPKFVRVVRSEISRQDGADHHSGSAHCFIERSTGNILKPAGWKGPEKKNPRGNIFAADPLAGVTQYGVVYLNR